LANYPRNDDKVAVSEDKAMVMAEYDKDFEQGRLVILAKQYPNIVQSKGEVRFEADGADRLSVASWMLEDEIYDQVTESGFKLHLMELLDTFLIYRGQFGVFPRNQGIVRFSGGAMTIEWWPDGTNGRSQ